MVRTILRADAAGPGGACAARGSALRRGAAGRSPGGSGGRLPGFRPVAPRATTGGPRAPAQAPDPGVPFSRRLDRFVPKPLSRHPGKE